MIVFPHANSVGRVSLAAFEIYSVIVVMHKHTRFSLHESTCAGRETIICEGEQVKGVNVLENRSSLAFTSRKTAPTSNIIMMASIKFELCCTAAHMLLANTHVYKLSCG